MAVIAATTLFGLPGSASAAPGVGSVSGNVVDELGSPLQNVCVMVENQSSTTTDSSGNFSITDLPEGQHRIQYSDCNDPRVYVTQWYLGAADESGAQYVDVVDSTDTPLSTVTMQPGVSVSGTVTDSGGSAIENIEVRLDPQGPYNSSSTMTDSNGDYRVGPVTDGQYDLTFEDTEYPQRYAAERWDDAYAEDSASTLDLMVTNGTELTGLDAQLAAASTISGNVQDESSNGLVDICVAGYLSEGGSSWWVSDTITDASGNYTLTGLPPRPIHVQFEDCTGAQSFLGQWYQNAPDMGSSTPISQGEGSSMGGINATLSTGVSISGSVTDSGGNPLADVDVSFEPAQDEGSYVSVQTGPDGNYTTNAIAVGQYVVRFADPNNNHATEYWDDSPIWDTADVLDVDGSGPISGINAQLSAGATIAGQVTDPSGSPAPGICVGAAYGADDYWDTVGWDMTDASGNYSMDRLPAGPIRVRFEDCDGTGPYLGEWYDNTPSFDNAQVLNLAEGETRSGVNARLAPAAQIKGTVRDTGGTPLEDICVQASTEDFVGGMVNTESDGSYSIQLASAGTYVVQFSDCGDQEHGVTGGKYLGQWWGGGIEPSSAQTVSVAVGATVKNIDAALSLAGGTGTVTGKVTNVRGQGLQACIVLYMPFESVRFAPTDPNGNFSFTEVPSGTWTLGFLGCGDEDVTPVIPDAGGTGVYFNAIWYDGVPLEIGADGPDPIAQGAKMITVHPNESLTANACFGCKSVTIKPPVVGDDYILVDFEALGLTTSPSEGPTAKASGLSYAVSCSSKSGKPTSATQTSYPVRVGGFTPGAPYVCSAQVLSDGTEVAASASFQVTVGTEVSPSEPGNTTDPGTDSGGTPTGQPVSSDTPAAGTTGSTGSAGATTPASLAFTGSNPVALLALATLMVLIGLGVTTTSKLRRRDNES